MADNEILASASGRTHSYRSLIPVPKLGSGDVTGIQPPRVCALNDSFLLGQWSLAPKDLGALDSCDKHRNEGDRGGWPLLSLEALRA